MGPQSINISFIEFFYDLIFAVVLSTFAYNIAFGWPNGKWLNIVQMLILLVLWRDNVVLGNLMYTGDGLSKTLMFLQLIGVLGMAFHRNVVVNGGGSTLIGFAVSFLWARFFTILQYGAAGLSKDERMESSTRVACLGYAGWLLVTCIPIATTCGFTNDASVYGLVMLWLLGVGLDLLLALLLPFLGWWRTAMPIVDTKRFRDRFGAFLIFLFLYLLVALFFDESGPYSAGEWGTLALLFLIAFCFMWLYYDSDRHDDEMHGCVAPLDRESFIWGHLWQALHLPLAMALIIMADASVQIVYFYRNVPRFPNTVLPLPGVPGVQLFLSNTVQWIYGISFAIALLLLTCTGLLYEYETRRHSKRKLERSVGRFVLVVVMLLIPLGGLNGFGELEPIVPVIVGAVILFCLVVLDWTLNTALAPEQPKREQQRTITVGGEQIQQLQARLAEQQRQIQQLQQEVQNARSAPAPVVAAEEVDKVESSEVSSSKDWGFSSRSSSVVEDVVVSSDGDESQQFENEDPMEGSQTGTREDSSTGFIERSSGAGTSTGQSPMSNDNNNNNNNNNKDDEPRDSTSEEEDTDKN